MYSTYWRTVRTQYMRLLAMIGSLHCTNKDNKDRHCPRTFDDDLDENTNAVYRISDCHTYTLRTSLNIQTPSSVCKTDRAAWEKRDQTSVQVAEEAGGKNR